MKFISSPSLQFCQCYSEFCEIIKYILLGHYPFMTSEGSVKCQKCVFITMYSVLVLSCTGVLYICKMIG